MSTIKYFVNRLASAITVTVCENQGGQSISETIELSVHKLQGASDDRKSPFNIIWKRESRLYRSSCSISAHACSMILRT